MGGEVVTSLYCHKHLISLTILDRQRQPLIRPDVKRREIWEWSDHTRSHSGKALLFGESVLISLLIV